MLYVIEVKTERTLENALLEIHKLALLQNFAATKERKKNAKRQNSVEKLWDLVLDSLII